MSTLFMGRQRLWLLASRLLNACVSSLLLSSRMPPHVSNENIYLRSFWFAGKMPSVIFPLTVSQEALSKECYLLSTKGISHGVKCMLGCRLTWHAGGQSDDQMYQFLWGFAFCDASNVYRMCPGDRCLSESHSLFYNVEYKLQGIPNN